MPDERQGHAAPQGLCRIETLFHEALALPAEQRTAFVAGKCADDASLAFEILDLIRLHDKSAGRLEAAAIIPRDPAPGTPQRIGQYTVVRLIGEGGMGRVYEAIQDQPRRTVALKVLRRSLATRALMRRFEYEAQVLAKLQHPNIAHVHEAGTYDAGEGPQPFFAMEFIQGLPITTHAQQFHLNVEERLDLFLQTCDGVEHAHRRGVIHRDLKPANILVTGQSRAPRETADSHSQDIERTAQPKIIDFGIARTLDSDIAMTTMHTEAGQLLGTLQYMSPEQCDGDAHDIDVRSDVYALGLILYELLYSARPYEIGDLTIFRAAHIIKEQRPIKPSTLDRAWKDDLETITLKALEKDRAQRYQSVAALSDDIRRYLRREPISAHPPSAMYKVRLFTRRNRAASAALAALALVLVAATVVSAMFALGQARARHEADRQSAEALRQAAITKSVNTFFIDDLLGAVDPRRTSNRNLTVREALDAAAARIEGRFEHEPMVDLALRETIGRTYMQMGRLAEAEPYLLKALELRRRENGDADAQTMEAMDYLGGLYKTQGRAQEALQMFQASLESAQRAFGDRHLQTLTSMNNVASMHREARRYDLAESLFSQAAAGLNEVMGKDDPHTIMVMHNLAYLYQQTGRYEQSEAIALEVLERRRRVEGAEHPATLLSMHNLALLYISQMRKPEALDLINNVIEMKERTLGPDHPDTLLSLGVQGSLLVDLKDFEAAEPIMQRVYQTRRRVLGEHHNLTFHALRSIAASRIQQGLLTEAGEILHGLLATQRQVQGSDHLDVTATLNALADLYAGQDRFGDRVAVLEEALSIRAARLGDTHRNTIETLQRLATLHRSRDEFEDALPYCERLHAAHRELEGNTGVNTLESAHTLAQVLFALGRLDEAASLALECFNGRQATVGPQHAATIETAELLVQIYHTWDKPDDAETWRAKLR